MKKQIPTNLDMLIVLAGENPNDKPRSKKAVEVYHEYGRIPLLLSGSHSGMNGICLPKGILPLSHQMRRHMLDKGVKDEDIIIEDMSMDTIANFYYSRFRGLIEYETKVGVDTDKFHMKRSLWLAKKVFGKSPEFAAVPSDCNGGLGQKMQENILNIILKHDLSAIADGDFDALRIYMQNVNPFHAYTYGNTPQKSWYGFLIEASKRCGINLRYKELEKQQHNV